MLEVVDDSLAVEEVHCSGQPVPVETLSRSQGAGAAGNVGDGDNLLKGDDLDSSDDCDDVNVTHEERGEEQRKHDKGPESARYEVGLFLFVLGLLFANCWLLLLLWVVSCVLLENLAIPRAGHSSSPRIRIFLLLLTSSTVSS